MLSLRLLLTAAYGSLLDMVRALFPAGAAGLHTLRPAFEI